MTGPEHYQAAEKLTKAANRRSRKNDDLLHTSSRRLELQVEALVHATLAAAAATALPAGSDALVDEDPIVTEWWQVAS